MSEKLKWLEITKEEADAEVGEYVYDRDSTDLHYSLADGNEEGKDTLWRIYKRLPDGGSIGCHAIYRYLKLEPLK